MLWFRMSKWWFINLEPLLHKFNRVSLFKRLPLKTSFKAATIWMVEKFLSILMTPLYLSQLMNGIKIFILNIWKEIFQLINKVNKKKSLKIPFLSLHIRSLFYKFNIKKPAISPFIAMNYLQSFAFSLYFRRAFA